MYKYLVAWILLMNIIGSIVNIADKSKAKHGKWRIPEKTLWSIALLGGAPLSYITMKIIRHKTKHISFMVGFPILAVLDIALLIFLYYKMNGGI